MSILKYSNYCIIAFVCCLMVNTAFAEEISGNLSQKDDVVSIYCAVGQITTKNNDITLENVIGNFEIDKTKSLVVFSWLLSKSDLLSKSELKNTDITKESDFQIYDPSAIFRKFEPYIFKPKGKQVIIVLKDMNSNNTIHLKLDNEMVDGSASYFFESKFVDYDKYDIYQIVAPNFAGKCKAQLFDNRLDFNSTLNDNKKTVK